MNKEAELTETERQNEEHQAYLELLLLALVEAHADALDRADLLAATKDDRRLSFQPVCSQETATSKRIDHLKPHSERENPSTMRIHHHSSKIPC